MAPARPACIMLTMLIISCTSPAPPAKPPPADPKVTALDRLLGKSSDSKDPQSCLAAIQSDLCPPAAGKRVMSIRLAMDRRYTRHWPAWEERLQRTLSCVNTLYIKTGVEWEIDAVSFWDPGSDRNNLYALLQRLQRKLPADLKSVTMGITLWDERRIYSLSGGEIGLSQRAACVVPSWPRVENDCVILAHELGHLAGAVHVPGKQWIMGWAARPFHLPAADPVARVTATYHFHPRNLEAIRLHARARFTRQGLKLPPHCLRRMRLVDRCWRLP